MARLKRFQAAAPVQSIATAQAIQVWNLMGGKIDWQALPYLAEYIEAHDLDMLINNLLIIHHHQDKKNG